MRITVGEVRHLIRTELREVQEGDGDSVRSPTTEKVLNVVVSLDTGGRIPLARIRDRLDDQGLSREEQDRALLDLQRAQELVLYRNDNPRELTWADKDAVLYINGSPRHLVYRTPPRRRKVPVWRGASKKHSSQ